MITQEITGRIPQRPPFLFVDRIVEQMENEITTEKSLTGEEDFFKGHFPGNPIMPGVLIQEACFQSAGLLMSFRGAGGLGVVTRVQKARFKNFLRPGDCFQMHVELTEELDNAFYFKAKVLCDKKKVANLEFTCAQISGDGA